MSDTLNDPSGGMENEARDTTGPIVDQQGRAVPPSRRNAVTAGATVDQIGDYVRQQPVSTALLALGLGYIIGRLRIF